MKASTSRKIAIYGAAAVLGLFALFPLYWMVLTSLKGEDELYTSTPDFFPNGWHGDRYWDVLVDRGIGKALLHSLYVATLSTIVAVAFATLAGYALARMYVPLKAVILLVLMAVQMLPVVVTLIPLFIQLRDWNLLDSLPGLALVYVAFNVPLAVLADARVPARHPGGDRGGGDDRRLLAHAGDGAGDPAARRCPASRSPRCSASSPRGASSCSR